MENNYINVNVSNPYKIYLDSKLQNIPLLLQEYTKQNKIIIICDKNIKKNHLPKLLKSLKNYNFKPTILTIKATEKNKSFKTVNFLVNKILKSSINKKTPIIAFGGGITGDIAGFCASIIYRGLPFFQIPTTLLAMVDSSVGGKCGVNSNYGKNTLGSFYQPSAVFIDTELLNTLSERDYKSGYSECLKYSILFSKDYFNYLDEHKNLFYKKDHNYLINIIKNSCGFKAKVVENDEHETNNLRYLLNLGHTFAHAFETYNNYKSNLTHGEAVSIGIILALKFSNFLGMCDGKNHVKIKEHLQEIGLPVDIKQVIKNINIKKIIKIMNEDKKNHTNNFTFILSEDIGNCIVNSNVSKENLKDFLKEAL